MASALDDRTGDHFEVSHQRRKQPTARPSVRTQFVADLHRRTVGHHPQHQSLLGEEPELVRQGATRDAGEHLLHLVEPSWPGDVQRSEDFNRPP